MYITIVLMNNIKYIKTNIYIKLITINTAIIPRNIEFLPRWLSSSVVYIYIYIYSLVLYFTIMYLIDTLFTVLYCLGNLLPCI